MLFQPILILSCTFHCPLQEHENLINMAAKYEVPVTSIVKMLLASNQKTMTHDEARRSVDRVFAQAKKVDQDSLDEGLTRV